MTSRTGLATSAVAMTCIATAADADAVSTFLDLAIRRCVEPAVAGSQADTSGLESGSTGAWTIPGDGSISLTVLDDSCFVMVMGVADAEDTDLLSGEVGEIADGFGAWADDAVAAGRAAESSGCLASDTDSVLSRELLATDPPAALQLEVSEMKGTGVYSISITAARGALARLCADRAPE